MKKVKIVVFLTMSWFILAIYTTNAQFNSKASAVEFSNFIVCPGHNEAHLNWATSSETNFHGFMVEKKYEDGEWSTVKFLNGHGIASRLNDYEYMDKDLAADGKYYYRLKILDVSGNYTYSSELSLSFKRSSHFSFVRVYPNPFNDRLWLQLMDGFTDKVSWHIEDASGKICIGKQTAVVTNQKVELDLETLAPGLYFLYVSGNNGLNIIKIVRQ